VLELGWLDHLKIVLGVVHLPLTALLIAAGVYFWRRGPERNEPWRPPEPVQRPSSIGPALAEVTPTDEPPDASPGSTPTLLRG
jgi:hypothetical protein